MQIIRTIQIKLTCILVFVLMVGSSYCFAQNQITLKGRILDSVTKEPLPFATISVPKSMTGTVSNDFGEFQYHIPGTFADRFVLISYIGYKTVKISASDVQSNDLKTIYLVPQTSQLSGVDVSGMDPYRVVEIVRTAIRKINQNYPREKFLLHAYYRGFVRPVWTDSIKNLMEAAVVIEDRGFQIDDFNRTKFKLEQLRYDPMTIVDTSLNIAYDGKNKFIPFARLWGANELTLLRAHDPIRNHKTTSFSFVDNLDLFFVQNHKFYFESIVDVDSVKTYCIRFEKYEKVSEYQSEYWVEGRMYINSKSYAILKFDYAINCNTPAYTGKSFDLKLEYKEHQGEYYLNYISLMNYFVIDRGYSFRGARKGLAPFFQYRELYVNKVVNKPFESIHPEEAIVRDSSIFINRIPVINGFWENYNYTGVLKLPE